MSSNLVRASRSSLCAKRAIDLVIAGTALIISLPLFALIIGAIKLTSEGPAIFRQQRYGVGGSVFILYKFRTMRQDAEQQLACLLAQNEAHGPVFKIKRDPRIVPVVGTFLRWSNLDELPQLLNVLRGQMSLVGPRPHEAFVVDSYAAWQRERLLVKPGMTCTWQIQPQRSSISFDDWIWMDLEYIREWSFLLDCKIIVQTVLLPFHLRFLRSNRYE